MENTAKTEEENFQSLISMLCSDDKNTCNDAINSILGKGESAVKPLVEALANKDEKVRWQAIRILEKLKQDWTVHTDEETINALINSFDSGDGRIRVRARQFIVAIGEKAVPYLTKALSNKDEHIRWETAKALGQIGDPEATQALIKALDDSVFDVRWLAAEGLAAIGKPAIIPLLNRLIDEPESPWVRDGVHYVLRNIDGKVLGVKLQPVLDALEDLDASIEAPIAAKKAIQSFITS